MTAERYSLDQILAGIGPMVAGMVTRLLVPVIRISRDPDLSAEERQRLIAAVFAEHVGSGDEDELPDPTPGASWRLPAAAPGVDVIDRVDELAPARGRWCRAVWSRSKPLRWHLSTAGAWRMRSWAEGYEVEVVCGRDLRMGARAQLVESVETPVAEACKVCVRWLPHMERLEREGAG